MSSFLEKDSTHSTPRTQAITDAYCWKPTSNWLLKVNMTLEMLSQFLIAISHHGLTVFLYTH